MQTTSEALMSSLLSWRRRTRIRSTRRGRPLMRRRSCRAALEQVWTLVVNDLLNALVWCLCAAIMRPNLGSIAHSVFLVDILSSLSVYWNLGLKVRCSQRENRKCACPTWRAWLGLPFDMLISAMGENRGSRAHAAFLAGVFSSLKFGHNFVTSRPYLCPEMMSLGKCKYELWRIR